MSLRTISLRPNPKRRKRKSARRGARKVKHRTRAHGYLVQGISANGGIAYVGKDGKWSTVPNRAHRYSTLKAATDECHRISKQGSFNLLAVQPVPA